ncbi:hypothetical protein Krad_4595 (plasmid) [Kineococcus radiotolerans SRS30216 = ATCC BAA-149]|uniref:Uncharacterized protein n=1 Tax=Kineococcus radiotolerans (strain ATCC BAA-149 / DSM 14245 / SRS30216) TaxID=266940 RepID=A6WGW5_KINRD|nr:hypothetical protein Krad_4595 [Kineococcus radiotolerans SRS30216 = ATCC BAA-149]
MISGGTHTCTSPSGSRRPSRQSRVGAAARRGQRGRHLVAWRGHAGHPGVVEYGALLRRRPGEAGPTSGRTAQNVTRGTDGDRLRRTAQDR